MFRSADLGYAGTETGPGHATLVSGTYPSTHGLVANVYFDRDLRQLVYCVGDESTHAVTSAGTGPEPGGVSPRNLRVPGLGDLLRAAYGTSRTVAISGKDRAAVALGGHEAETVLWWGRRAGGFESSSYYGAALPDWVLEWNETWIERYASFARTGWTPLLTELSGSGTAADDREGEASPLGDGRTFPHALPALEGGADQTALARAASAAWSSPLTDQFVLDLAGEAVRELGLGSDEAPDLLALGLSACDVVGHSFGPYSREVTDVLLRLDDELETLFDELDERLGRAGWIACLASDHGVLELPEALVERGVDARRVPAEEMVALRTAIVERFASAYESDLGYDYADGLVFDSEQIREHDLEPVAVWRLAAEIARGVDWIARAYTFDELLASGADERDPLRRLSARSVAPGRGPDVTLVLDPWALLSMPSGTSHGSPYEYDRHVPLAFLGPGFDARQSHDPVGAVDVLPTLLGALGLRVPEHVEGRDLRR